MKRQTCVLSRKSHIIPTRIMSETNSIPRDYAGWILRLNLPKSRRINKPEFKPDEEGKDVWPDAPLLPNDGLLTSSTDNKDRFLAELCPIGVSVGTLSKTIDKNISPPDRSTWSWSYSSQSSPSQWNVTSSKLLSITYRPAQEANPSYTNISRSRQYWQRSFGRGLDLGGQACRTGCRKCTSGENKRPDQSTSWDNVKRGITGAPKPIHRFKVDYTVEDILRIEPLLVDSTSGDCGSRGLWIRGVGNCHALRIFLRPKFRSFSSSDCNCSYSYGGVDEDSFQGDLRFDGKNNDDEFEMPPMEEWDNLPSPPWAETEDTTASLDSPDTATKPAQWGPILTFAIPHQSSSNDGASRKSHVMHECPPLIWKVEHPTNPNVAVDCMTLIEGTLHLHNQSDLRVLKNQPSLIETEANEDNVEVEMEQNFEDRVGDSSSSSYDYDKPTNVYIHGYQSWSFSGSVVQGEPQPTSAMPFIYSEAFNRGGIVYSAPTCDLSDVCGIAMIEHWHKDEDVHSNLREGDQIDYAPVDAHDEELNEISVVYTSHMFSCISSNGATARLDEEHVLLDEEGGPALIVGFMSQREQFGTVLIASELRQFNLYACNEGVIAKRNMTTDWAYLQVVDSSCYDEEAMAYYVHAVGDHNDSRPMEKGLTTGWCSWYHYYSDIDHDSLSRNAHILEQNQTTIGFNVCLIDDGYMTAWGDWASLKPGKFVKDGGMRVLADAIRSKGMKPGVWLAPFACDKFSQLAKDHPDWIIRNDSGRCANSANCGKFFYGLDATNPAVRKHVYDTIKRAVDEWGFDVLKLDFLYSSCLAGNGKYDNSMTRAEAMYLGMRTIRAAAKDAFIIGCGCPIGSAIGFVDGMRVSCDTGPTWNPEFPLPHWDNGTLPALRGMLRNTMSRAPFGHRWWHNDPDCILLGESTKLTDAEVVSAATIVAMTGGMFLLSDDMLKVSEKRLNVAKRIFPLTGATAVPLDLHSTLNKGMPSVLRLWCTENVVEKKNSNAATKESAMSPSPKPISTRSILQDQASTLEFEVGYRSGYLVDPYSRERSCFTVAPGLGTWTIVSLSNWMDHSARLRVSFSTLVKHSLQDFHATGHSEGESPCELSECGFHVFSFWSSEYTWIPHKTLVDNNPLIKMLQPHETEIFHIKPANPTRPQYIGSDLHFSCGFEVQSFEWSVSRITLRLKNEYDKRGSIFLYLPESVDGSLSDVVASVCGEACRVEVVAKPAIVNGTTKESKMGRVVKIPVSIAGSRTETDGQVSITW